jgi:hypothetical protein
MSTDDASNDIHGLQSSPDPTPGSLVVSVLSGLTHGDRSCTLILVIAPRAKSFVSSCVYMGQLYSGIVFTERQRVYEHSPA